MSKKRILAIIQRKKDRAFWRQINYVLGKQQGGAVRNVEVQDKSGETVETTNEAETNKAIWNEVHHKCFHLAK